MGLLETKLDTIQQMARMFDTPDKLVDVVVGKMSDQEVEECTNQMGYQVINDYVSRVIQEIDTKKPHTETLRLVLKNYFVDNTDVRPVPQPVLEMTGTYG